MCDSGAHLSTGEETAAPKSGPTFLSSWVLGSHATAVTSECVPELGMGQGSGLHKAARQEATEEVVEAGLWAGTPCPAHTQDTEMEQGAGPQCDHLCPEGLGPRVPGPAGPQCWKMGLWSHPQRPFETLPCLGAVSEQGLPGLDPSSLTEPLETARALPRKG